MPELLLPDIPRGPTWGEKWKRTCLCRSIRRKSEADRNEFMRLVQAKHGREFAVSLYREAMEGDGKAPPASEDGPTQGDRHRRHMEVAPASQNRLERL